MCAEASGFRIDVTPATVRAATARQFTNMTGIL
jgi:hypothetical protein